MPASCCDITLLSYVDSKFSVSYYKHCDTGFNMVTKNVDNFVLSGFFEHVIFTLYNYMTWFSTGHTKCWFWQCEGYIIPCEN